MNEDPSDENVSMSLNQDQNNQFPAEMIKTKNFANKNQVKEESKGSDRLTNLNTGSGLQQNSKI